MKTLKFMLKKTKTNLLKYENLLLKQWYKWCKYITFIVRIYTENGNSKVSCTCNGRSVFSAHYPVCVITRKINLLKSKKQIGS